MESMEDKMRERIRIGVIGCGHIAQIMHLPYLKELESLYEVKALCDISKKLVNKMSDFYNIKERYTDYRELLSKSNIDAVIILTPINHSEIAICAAKRGKHVFTEKPMCISMKEADNMIDTAQKNKIKLMVGHMRLFDPGYQYAQKIIREMKDVSLIRLHSSTGKHPLLSNIYTLYRFDDIPEEEKRKDKEFIEEKKKELGNLSEEVKKVYLGLIGGAIHDVYPLRGLFGSPKKVLFTETWRWETKSGLVSILEYNDDLRCIYSFGPWGRDVQDFDAGFIVYGKEKVVDFKFTFSTYFKNDPTSLIVREMEGDVFVEKSIRVSFDESFRRKLIHFHNCIIEDKEPLSSGKEAKKDLELLLEIAKKLR